MLALNAAAAPMAPASSPSQILVLGMHHSGTSVVSNLTMMMGAYGGQTDELLLHPENPLKFWERRDVVALDEQRLVAGVQPKVGDRYDVPEWVAYGFDAAKPTTKVHEMAEAQGIVKKLDAQRPWVTKDPRMCLVADEWMPLLDAPLCLIVHREPLSVANSMMIYSHNVSLAEWASVYEAYYTNAMRACHGVRAAAAHAPRHTRGHAHHARAHTARVPSARRRAMRRRRPHAKGGGGLSLTRRLARLSDPPLAEADGGRAARGARRRPVRGRAQAPHRPRRPGRRRPDAALGGARHQAPPPGDARAGDVSALGAQHGRRGRAAHLEAALVRGAARREARARHVARRAAQDDRGDRDAPHD